MRNWGGIVFKRFGRPGLFSMIGAVIDGPPDEIVHRKYIEEARSGEIGVRREKSQDARAPIRLAHFSL
jgi:hypothetical protein